MTTGTAPPNLSEQFLYWAIKTRTADPSPNEDGTWLEFARDATRSEGICTDANWPYSGQFDPSNIPHAGKNAPSSTAIADAAARRFAKSKHRTHGNGRGGAARLLKALAKGRPVAISLPVFRDAMLPDGPDNWSTSSAWTYGRVIDPPPTAVVAGGHAVCVIGFEPDPIAPGDGHFVFRNSWDVIWASGAPAAGYSYAPEPGYGDVSLAYVDDYLWELFQL